MTVPATARRAGPYNGNGATTSFSFSFKTFAAGDLLVTKTDALGVEIALVKDSDYSVTLNGDQDASPGGSITYPLSGSPLPSGQKLTITSALDLEQTTDLLGGGAFNARVIEDTFDRTVVQIQQLDEALDRTLKVGVSSTADPTLPSPEASSLIGWDATGTALQNIPIADLATAVAYGTMRYQTFNGNGSTTSFALTHDPVTVGNLDVAISGVVQAPGADYNLVGQNVVFTSAPPNGSLVMVRYGEALGSVPSDSNDISFQQAGTGAVTRTAQAKMRDLPSVTDFGISADGTDQTSALVTWLNSLSASTKAIYLVPYNCKFNVTTVMAAMPAGVMFLDLSGLNGYSSPGNTAKRVGIFARDTAPDDSAWQIVSGHNAGLQFNNFGTSGSTSAAERVQAIIYSSGMFASGTQGYREMAEVVLKQATGNDFWEWNWNSMAPWLAIAANYEYWATGVAATSGVTYVLSDFKIYVAASTGTTGSTAPTHSSGTVSDGGVSWTFVRNTSSAILSLDEFGRIRSNAGVATTDLLSLKQSNQDPATSCVATIQAKATAGTPRFVQLVMNPTNGATPSIVEAQPAIRATAGVGLQVMKSDGSGALVTFSDAGGVEVKEFRSAYSTAANGDASPSVAGVGTLYVDNSGATSITALDDGSDGQIVTVITLNANTSFTHSSTLMLTGSTNVTTPAAFSSITFQKVPSFISNRWIEIARSLK